MSDIKETLKELSETQEAWLRYYLNSSQKVPLYLEIVDMNMSTVVINWAEGLALFGIDEEGERTMLMPVSDLEGIEYDAVIPDSCTINYALTDGLMNR